MRGKVASPRCTPHKSKDHPRTCGEKGRPSAPYTDPQGSPPHMRGKVWHGGHTAAQCGITPAHAGKSCQSQSRCRRWWDHPRTCGEKLVKDTSRGGVPGITPAHAGKRDASGSAAILKRDHPRTCGEKGLFRGKCAEVQGSPPHMRGKGQTFPQVVTLTGITPAHAGKRTVGHCSG